MKNQREVNVFNLNSAFKSCTRRYIQVEPLSTNFLQYDAMKRVLVSIQLNLFLIHTTFIFIIQHLYTENIAALHDADISNLHAFAFGHGICILTYANELVHYHCLNEEH